MCVGLDLTALSVIQSAIHSFNKCIVGIQEQRYKKKAQIISVTYTAKSLMFLSHINLKESSLGLDSGFMVSGT